MKNILNCVNTLSKLCRSPITKTKKKRSETDRHRYSLWKIFTYLTKALNLLRLCRKQVPWTRHIWLKSSFCKPSRLVYCVRQLFMYCDVHLVGFSTRIWVISNHISLKLEWNWCCLFWGVTDFITDARPAFCVSSDNSRTYLERCQAIGFVCVL